MSPAIGSAGSARAPWQRWRSLPREGRDTLFLLAVIAWTLLPHMARLPLWCSLLTGTVLLWRLRLALSQAPLPGRWVVVGVLLLAAGLTLWTHRTLLGKEAGVTLLVVLMALKTLELRARRDAFVVFFLGFFLVLTHFLYSQSLAVAAAMLVSVWGLLTALVLAHMPVGQPALRQAAALAARCALLGTPIVVLLFLLFPRVAPLWNMPGEAIGKTGLSHAMRMGSVAEVAADDSIALRLRFAPGVRTPPQGELYFRGPVLSRFDGREWLAAPFVLEAPRVALRPRGRAVDYEVTFEPSRSTILPLLEATVLAPALEGNRALRRADLEWRTERPITERMRFDVRAYTAFDHGPVEFAPALRSELLLPGGANPRTQAWASQFRRNAGLEGAEADALAAALMAYIRRAGFVYTLTPGVYAEDGGLDAIDEFWLDRRQGFCEHYAAAFVVILRSLGVPARVVTGYQGTDPEPVDGFFIVRQSNAHAWAEYWQAGRGWVRADPTAAIAPERIVRSRRLQPAPGLVAGAIGGVSPALLAQLRRAWETVDNRWNQWVLNYSRSQQFDLLKDLGFRSPGWEDLALLLISALTGLSLAGAAWAWWDRRRQDPWARLLARVRRALRSLGLDAAPHETPAAWAAQLQSRFGDAAVPLAALLLRIERQRYGRGALRRPQPGAARSLWREALVLRRAVPTRQAAP